MFRCRDVTFHAYYCVQLFDSIGFELYAKDLPLDLQEVKGPHGLGIYCTLDLESAQETGKTVLLAEFKANTAERGVTTGVNVAMLAWCVECIRVLYRREWPGAISWPALKRIVDAMQAIPCGSMCWSGWVVVEGSGGQ
eukprot:Skav214336  [mRNA]  locus=scaffold86:351705:353995:+ [translate_table: standard]